MYVPPPSLGSGRPGVGDDGLGTNVKRFRGGLVFKAHRRLYHSTLDLRVLKKQKVDLGWAMTVCDQGKQVPPLLNHQAAVERTWNSRIDSNK